MKILVRLGADLTIKSDRIRAQFVSRMLRNMNAAFTAHGIKAKVLREWSRLFVESNDPRTAEVVGRIFGVASYSVVEHQCVADLETIGQVALAAYKEQVRGKSFAIRARRIGVKMDSSMAIATHVGALLLPFARKVDLTRPEVEIFIEVRHAETYLFSSSHLGPGGLPLGVSGRILCLISGGFDSAVAAWMMQKRGVEMDYLFCNLAGGAYERSVLSLAKQLSNDWSYGSKSTFHILDFAPLTEQIRERVRPSHAQIVLKRLFYRAANAIAARSKAEALLTGECIGQVSSQTLRNLCTIETVSDVPILRPLIGWDKDEITTLARRIGTFSLSAQIQEYCQLVPDKPVTACTLEAAVREESVLDPDLLEQALRTRRSVVLSTLTASDLVMPYLYIDSIPAGAKVIDCRPAEAHAAWHYPDAECIEVHELFGEVKRFDKLATYILYCPVGLQSAVAAERLQKAGVPAYSFKGGVEALRRYAALTPDERRKREAHLERDGLPSAEKINLGEKSQSVSQ